LIGVSPALYVAAECLAPAVRVVKRAWPDVIQIDDVKEITAEHFKDWYIKRPRLKRLLISAGFPCQGMSGLNAQAKGLADQRSCLFWEIVRIHELAKSSWPKMQIALLVENTESKYLPDVTVAVGLRPVLLEAGDICDARRPRFYWCSWELLACDDIEKVVPTERGWNVRLLNQGHGPARWLDHGSSF